MVDYSILYHIMLDASERAIDAIEDGDCDNAKSILIEAELRAEAAYVESDT